MVKSSHEREERQQKKNRMIISGVIIFIMVGSTIGFFFGSNSSNNDELEYKGKNGEKYTFVQSNGQIWITINGHTLGFYSHPLDAISLNISDEAKALLTNSQVFYITFDPNSRDIQYIEQARFDLEKDFFALKKYSSSGVSKNSSLYLNYPIITCANATVYTPVINFIDANNTDTRGYVNGSCIIFEGKRDDFLRFRDFIVYRLYGVI